MSTIIVRTPDLKVGDIIRECEGNDWDYYVVTKAPVKSSKYPGWYDFSFQNISGSTYNDRKQDLKWKIDRSDRDQRTLWVSDDNTWAVVRCSDICDIKPPIIASYGYIDLISAIGHAVSSYPKDYNQFAISPNVGTTTGSWHFQPYSSCFCKVKRLDLPWEKQDNIGKKVISNYPSTCIFCGAPAYVSALSVDHEPGKAAPNCPANR